MNKLFIVATPLGNLGDITLRALEVLRSVKLIACEDTRNSKKLLDHYGIKSRLVSYHQHSGQGKTDWLIDYLKREGDVALITDAGTPGIADPGNKLIAEVVSRLGGQVETVPLPGPSAIIAALSISGLPTDKFLFLGFLPHKKGKETMIKRITESKETAVFYESTHRIAKTMEMLSKFFDSSRQVVVCRELTKKFETVYRGNIGEVSKQLEIGVTKGEFVVVIEGKR